MGTLPDGTTYEGIFSGVVYNANSTTPRGAMPGGTAAPGSTYAG